MLTLRIEASFAKFAQTFRKKLPVDYKKGNKHSHRNMHAIPMLQKDHLMNAQKGGNWKKIRELERQSLRPFGKFKRSGFVLDKEKLPFYDIPDLTGFQLKPYVEYNAPLLSKQLHNHQTNINNQKLSALK